MMAAADLGQHKSRGTIIMRGPARFRGLLTVKTTISVCVLSLRTSCHTGHRKNHKYKCLLMIDSEVFQCPKVRCVLVMTKCARSTFLLPNLLRASPLWTVDILCKSGAPGPSCQLRHGPNDNVTIIISFK